MTTVLLKWFSANVIVTRLLSDDVSDGDERKGQQGTDRKGSLKLQDEDE